MANGYLGTNKVEISVQNQEIVPPKKEKWTLGYHLYKFSFLNHQNCLVVVNQETEIYLEAGQGFEIDRYDKPITSFIIKNADIPFTWVGAF
ncbi:hypothetical protein M3649_04290 [Ureibacillus chungkukjangi]|uniref:hypothetical protein n=1 Tax=Ureibacillus chungkukjangi TaxID=1202712 RepID=UPI0020425803|nr:hypothetical protein [Ureibacillus chungkukjangi]MCM3387353.1 hypothetical protein [Ureibacillus chungkukjangi]